MYKDVKSLVTQYLVICNTVFRNQLKTPNMRKSLTLAKTIHKYHNIVLTVYCGDPDTQVTHFLIRFRDNQFEFISERKDDSSMQWELKFEDIENVVKKSEEYINNPNKLGWDCLFSRIGIKFDVIEK